MKDTNKIYGFPDPLAKDSEKKSDKYGLDIAKAIEQEWFNGKMINDNCEYGQRRDWIRKNRRFVRGEQDVKPYKEHLSRQEGDLEYLNLDWTLLNIGEKFCNIVANGIADNNYRLDIRAIDKVASKLKKDRESYHKRNMYSKELIKSTKELFGLDLSPKSYVPEDNEELALYMEIKERPKIEIAEELCIDFVNKTNNADVIEKLKNKDLVVNGIAVTRIWTDPNDGIKKAYVDPEYFIHSQVTKPDFSDAFYFGYVESLTIGDIQRESDFDEKTLRKIAEMYGTNAGHFSPRSFETCNFSEIIGIPIDVLRFAYKTSKKIVYKKSNYKNGVKVTKRDDNYDPPERSDYGKIDQVLDTWYEGNFIIGSSSYIYGYQECENLVRGEMNKVKPPYNITVYDIYKNQLRSFLTNMEAPINQMQYIHLKIQHLIAELKPDIINIDLDQLAELGDGEGGSKRNDWREALNLLNVKGVVLTKRVDMGEMGVKEGQAAKPVASSQGSALGALLNSWAHYYNLLRDLTGVNPVRDGSQSQDSLVGVNEMAMLASNTATRHIVEAAINHNKKDAEIISARLHDIFSHKEAVHLKKLYERAVGKHNLDAVESLKNRNLHEFGFTVEMNPTSDEIREFREDLSIAMQEGFIDIEVKQQAQQIFKTNHKLANQYLQYRRRKAIQQRMAEREYEAQLQSQSNAQAAQASAQAQTQSYAVQAQIDVKKAEALARIEMLKELSKHKLQMEENAQEFDYDAYLKKLELASNIQLNVFKEDRKDQRSKEQGTQQSKMIKQRETNGEPIDFKNEFDFDNLLR